MELDHNKAVEIAKHYFGINTDPTRLGWGVSGFVYMSPDLETAVKVHRREDGFYRELKVYQELRKKRMSILHGLTIPKLRNFNSQLRLIQIDVVSTPYLLDFAGASFGLPDYSNDVWLEWHKGIAEMFGDNADIVYAVYHSLKSIGIYYTDFRPSNIKLNGHPDYKPPIIDDNEEY